MAFQFAPLVHGAVETLFKLGGEWIKDLTYIRPVGLNPATGVFTTAEVTADCKALLIGYAPMRLALAPAQAGDEKLLVRSEELAGIENPVEHDYFLIPGSSDRWHVEAARLDVTGDFWLFQVSRDSALDWGDLSPHTSSEDRGTVESAPSAREDWGSLY